MSIYSLHLLVTFSQSENATNRCKASVYTCFHCSNFQVLVPDTVASRQRLTTQNVCFVIREIKTSRSTWRTCHSGDASTISERKWSSQKPEGKIPSTSSGTTYFFRKLSFCSHFMQCIACIRLIRCLITVRDRFLVILTNGVYESIMTSYTMNVRVVCVTSESESNASDWQECLVCIHLSLAHTMLW